MINIVTQDDILREVQMMTAAGWALYRREPDGAVFTSGSRGSGIPGWLHVVLIVLSSGIWIIPMIVIELFMSDNRKFCRLTFDPWGDPRYEPIKKPRR
jgi:hypothetical protein